MKFKKVNFFQLLEILDGFGGILLGSWALLMKQQWNPVQAMQLAEDWAKKLNESESVDSFDAVNTSVSWQATDGIIKVSYYSRSGKLYKFYLNLEEGCHLGSPKKINKVFFPRESALGDFIKDVCKNEGKHPNPLFR